MTRKNITELLFRIPQFFRFAAIGVINTATHFCLLYLLAGKAGLNPVAGNFIAYLLASVFSYFMNTYLTFRLPPSLMRYVKFLGASLFALGATLLISWLMDRWGFGYKQGFIAIALVVPVLNFISMKYWTFRVKRQ